MAHEKIQSTSAEKAMMGADFFGYQLLIDFLLVRKK
jgi:hypothetical protein